MKKIILLIFIVFFVSSCATFGVQINGKFDKEPVKNINAKKVNVLFVFRHTKQLEGLDAIPKLVAPSFALKDFNDIFLDALKEFSNIQGYDLLTETSKDIEWSDKAKRKETLKKNNNYTIETTILKKESFTRNFLGGFVSLVSLSLIPVSYPKEYYITAKVYDVNGSLLKEYNRSGFVKDWVQLVMLYYYPSHTPEKATEELYSTILHDIFREIEHDKLLI